MGYVNGPPRLIVDFDIKGMRTSYSKQDIVYLNDGYFALGFGWYGLESIANGDKWRWMSQSSVLEFIVSEYAQCGELKITIASFRKPRACTIYVNGSRKFDNVISTAAQEIYLVFEVVPGVNKVVISSPDKAESPVEFPEMNNPDRRQLTFMVKKIEIKVK